ncbi:MAG: hypothetical protein AAF462_10340, partial [Thermodesulfobacteriota bacterium]
KNGKLMDATVSLIDPQTEEKVGQGRTYKKENTNPMILTLEPGIYNVEVASVEIEGKPTQVLEGIEIVAGERVEKVVDYSSGTIKIGVTKGQKRIDAVVKVIDANTGENVAQGRSYTGEKTNPKVFDLEPGTYNVLVEPVGIKDNPSQTFENIEVAAGETVEKTAEFSSGVLKIGAFEGEKFMDAVVYVTNSETEESVTQGRTYKSSKSNPKTFELSPGTYDISVKALGITNNPIIEFKGVEVVGGEELEHKAQFESGTLKIGAKDGEKLVQATITVTNSTTGERVSSVITYPQAKSNPKVLVLTPGVYDVNVTAAKMSTKPSQDFKSIELNAGDTIEEIVQFPRGTIKVSASSSGENIQSTVRIKDPKTTEQLTYGYTDEKPRNNPKEFILPPASYEVVVEAYKMEGKPEKVFNIELGSDEVVDLNADF